MSFSNWIFKINFSFVKWSNWKKNLDYKTKKMSLKKFRKLTIYLQIMKERIYAMTYM